MDISIPRKKNGLPLLYKSDIEEIAELYLEDFNPQILKKPMPTPIDKFLENYLQLDMDHANITPDESILGLTAFDNGFLTVYDSEHKRDRDIYVKEGTVVLIMHYFQRSKKEDVDLPAVMRVVIGYCIGKCLNQTKINLVFLIL